VINKRLLIKNLLAYNDENSFYDKKRQLNLHTKEGKAKFLKHICALSNSNPTNNSYIVVGVEDHNNEIVGTDFFDDSHIQNLINAFLVNPPKIQYENVPFPQLPKGLVLGLVTIKPKSKISFFKKTIHTIAAHTIFIRRGSNSIPTVDKIPFSKINTETVIGIENNSRNNISHTLDGVLDFMMQKHPKLELNYLVFKELFVVCWSGNSKTIRQQLYYSRVDVSLINEQIKLFYSALDVVTISYDSNTFSITEYVPLGLNDKTSFYPLEKQTLYFFDNGYYKIETQFLFDPPQYNRKMMYHIYNAQLILIQKLEKNISLNAVETKSVISIPETLMICYFNGFEDAKQKLIEAKPFLKKFENSKAFINFKESMRILRKMKYDKI
jgi:hypothetical protein